MATSLYDYETNIHQLAVPTLPNYGQCSIDMNLRDENGALLADRGQLTDPPKCVAERNQEPPIPYTPDPLPIMNINHTN